MTTHSFSSTGANTNDTAFRAWGSAVSSALTTVGITKTSDTGQIDWTTVTAPASGGTFQGYEIRQFTDSTQATAPIYFKIEYGATGFGVSCPGMRVTVGTATNDTGGISAQASSTATFGLDAATAGAFNSYMSSDGSYLAFAGWPGYSSSTTVPKTAILIIDRIRNADGTPTSDGGIYLAYQSAGQAGALWYGFNRALGIWGTQGGAGPALLPQLGSTGVNGGDVYLSAHMPAVGGRITGPSRAALTTWRGDVTQATTFTASLNGVNRTWLSIGTSATHWDFAARAFAGLAIIWE